MSKAENFTVRLDGELKQRMKNHPEINWSHVVREHVRSMLDDIERMNQVASQSQLGDEDAEDLADLIEAAATERARNDLADSDLDLDALCNESDDPQRRSHREDVDVQ